MKKTICSLLALALIGCSNSYVMKKGTYRVNPFTIHVMEDKELKDKFRQIYHRNPYGVAGFYYKKTREVFVIQHADLEYNHELLGHEIWHLEELGGRYHK